MWLLPSSWGEKRQQFVHDDPLTTCLGNPVWLLWPMKSLNQISDVCLVINIHVCNMDTFTSIFFITSTTAHKVCLMSAASSLTPQPIITWNVLTCGCNKLVTHSSNATSIVPLYDLLLEGICRVWSQQTAQNKKREAGSSVAVAEEEEGLTKSRG